MRLRESRGSVLDHLHVAGADEVRRRLRARVRILIAGLTTRALAESAVRAGAEIVTVDYFGDLDQERLCETHPLRERGADTRLPRSSRWRAASRTTPSCTAEAWRTIRTWSPSSPAIGCCSATRPTRSAGCAIPVALFRYLAGRGFAVPDTRFATDPLPGTGRWLLKPARGGGGQGVRAWTGQRPGADCDRPGGRRGRERIGLFRGRRSSKRDLRLDRAAPRPAGLPVRGQRHAARGRGGDADGSGGNRRRPDPGVRPPRRERLRLRAPRGPSGRPGGEPALLRVHGAGRTRGRNVGVRPPPRGVPGRAPGPRRRHHGRVGKGDRLRDPGCEQLPTRPSGSRGASATFPTRARSFAPGTPSARSWPRSPRARSARPRSRPRRRGSAQHARPIDRPVDVDRAEDGVAAEDGSTRAVLDRPPRDGSARPRARASIQ